MKNFIFNSKECGVNNKVNNYLKENWEIIHNKDKFMDKERRKLNIWCNKCENRYCCDNMCKEKSKNKGFIQHRRFIDKTNESSNIRKNTFCEFLPRECVRPMSKKTCKRNLPYKTELYTFKDKEIGVKTCKNPYNKQKIIIKTYKNKCNGEQSVKKKIIKCDGSKNVYYKKIKSNGQKYRWYKIDNN